MTWFKVDDSFYDHPKVFDAPDCAVALWVRAGCWSARNLTDGFVPANMLARLCDDPDTAVRELVKRGLWTRTKGGYQFHDWAQYQPTAAKVRETRAKRAEAGRRGGKAKAAAQTRNVKQTASNLPETCQPFAKQNPAPSRPETLSRVDVGDHPQVRNARDVRDDDDRLISIVAGEMREPAGRDISRDEALAVIAEIRRRADEAGTVIHHPLRYFPAAIANEPDVYVLLLADVDPLAGILAGFADALPPGDLHEYDHDPATSACRECDMPRSNQRHRRAS